MATGYEAFEAWQTIRVLRRTGRPPAPRTLLAYTMRLRGTQVIGGFASAEDLARCLATCPLSERSGHPGPQGLDGLGRE